LSEHASQVTSATGGQPTLHLFDKIIINVKLVRIAGDRSARTCDRTRVAPAIRNNGAAVFASVCGVALLMSNLLAVCDGGNASTFASERVSQEPPATTGTPLHIRTVLSLLASSLLAAHVVAVHMSLSEHVSQLPSVAIGQATTTRNSILQKLYCTVSFLNCFESTFFIFD
jgi:hypothetical protein